MKVGARDSILEDIDNHASQFPEVFHLNQWFHHSGAPIK